MNETADARCGARLRRGGSCELPPAPGKRRCFQHGGARGIGAPKGSRNAWKHGAYTREQIAQRRRISAFLRECVRTIREIEQIRREERRAARRGADAPGD